MAAFHHIMNGLSTRILLVNLALAVETGVAGCRSALAAGFGLHILAQFTSSTAFGRADVFLRLRHIKWWWKGGRTVVISHFSRCCGEKRAAGMKERALVGWWVD
jgi:hypothetical protein